MNAPPSTFRPRLQADLAAADDHGRAADLDAFDAIGPPADARVQSRWASDLRSLADLDLDAERDALLAGEVDGERSGR